MPGWSLRESRGAKEVSEALTLKDIDLNEGSFADETDAGITKKKVHTLR